MMLLAKGCGEAFWPTGYCRSGVETEAESHKVFPNYGLELQANAEMLTF